VLNGPHSFFRSFLWVSLVGLLLAGSGRFAAQSRADYPAKAAFPEQSDGGVAGDAPTDDRSGVPAGRYSAITLRAPSTSISQPPSARGGAGDISWPGERAAASGDPVDSGDAAAGDGVAKTSRSMAIPLVTIGSSLALVLGLFGALVWVSKKAQRGVGSNRSIPDEVLRVLGQKNLGPLGTVSLIRCGRSVLVVSASQSGIQSLATITDDEEVRHLEAACQGDSIASFKKTLGEMQREPAGRGFVGEGIEQPHPRKKLFA
jgi:flagellar biogenesis protein FliO